MIYKTQLNEEITGDGSTTLYRADLNETYHSRHGAITESRHIFLNHGFLHSPIAQPKILEIGFGTGLNALLTAQASVEKHRKTQYIGIDNNFLPIDVTKLLNYPGLIPNIDNLYKSICQTPIDKPTQINEYFTLLKLACDIAVYVPEQGFDIVYFDAFSPDVQPHLWTEIIFKRIFAAMQPGSIFVTYSAKGTVRRTLQSVGFEVSRCQGPLGKKHITRATKPL
jgi:tRNA U34 5-methylaminomethyl-2-thiouridine-forming methyltransferase MnmC